MSMNQTTNKRWRPDLLRRRAQYLVSIAPDTEQRTIPVGAPASGPMWRICLLGENDEALVLNLYGDAIFGRETDTDPHSVDLSTWRASELGVSRRHAMLRPTASGLYLIDLGSTNGTYHNSVLLGKGSARPIEDSDMIMLGSLVITILILKAPSEQSNDLST
jgi:hypothetical protein